jgi:predicted DNA binding CopG/RHH family protein
MKDLANSSNGATDSDSIELRIPVPKDLMRRLKSEAALQSLPLYQYVNRILAAVKTKPPAGSVKPSTPTRS